MAGYLVWVNIHDDAKGISSKMVKVMLQDTCSIKEFKESIHLKVKNTISGNNDFDINSLKISSLGNSENVNFLTKFNGEQQKRLRLSCLPIINRRLFCSFNIHSTLKTSNKENIKQTPKIQPDISRRIQSKKINFKPLTSYTFYESNKKFVMLILKLENIEKYQKNKINVSILQRSIDVQIVKDDINIKDNWRFKVAKTHDKYVPEESKYWVKKNKLIIKLKKKNEDRSVFSLYKQKMVGESKFSDESD
jgi:hypothetical protein